MRLIKKTAAPASLQKYKRDFTASYKSMDTDVKNDLLHALIAEQKGVCAYCQQLLNFTTATIEHHCEHSICDGTNGTTDKRLDYKNLLAVCPGKGGSPIETHCDTRKAECAGPNAIVNGLPMQLNPTTAAHIRTIVYSSTGLIKSSNTVYDREINHLLNLNTRHLKLKRKEKWLKIFRNSRSKHTNSFDKRKMKKLLEDDLALRTVMNTNFDIPRVVTVFSNDLPGLSSYMRTKFC